MSIMLEENTGLLTRKGAPGSPTVVLHPRAYTTISKVARARMPAATFGALVGKTAVSGPDRQVAVAEAVPMDLDAKDAGLASWNLLKTRLESDEHGFRLVGWFCADPGIGARPAKVDPFLLHQALAPDGDL